MPRGGLGGFSGARAPAPAREAEPRSPAAPQTPANDNLAPLAVRLAEAAKWLSLLGLIFGVGIYLFH